MALVFGAFTAAYAPSLTPLMMQRAPLALLRMQEDLSPSDIDEGVPSTILEKEDEVVVGVVEPVAATVDVEASSMDATREERQRLTTGLLALAAGCSRGEAASSDDLAVARGLVADLEGVGSPIPSPTLTSDCQGTWELIFSDTQLFRSSPFFMAGRAVCEDGEQAAQYDWFCDMHRAALAISTIGKVRQVVSESQITSEFEVSAGAVPFLGDATRGLLGYSGGLPLAIRGSIVSTASIESNDGSGWNLLMDTVEIKGSNIPLLRQALDAGLRLGTRDLGAALESAVPQYANPRPKFETTYLDGTLRISRDQDGKIFVYQKTSPSTTPTDYASVAADLGVGDLLSGALNIFSF